MVFSSQVFLFLFLPAVLALNFLAGPRLRNVLLLVASLLFYAWGEAFYVLLMLASIVLNHLAGRAIDRWRGNRKATWALAGAVAANLALLGFFKYADFLIASVNPGLVAMGLGPLELPGIHLPIGISFFTFQAISYVVDVHRGTAESQRNILTVGLYISLFPQLIAGPIIRYHDIAKQLLKRHTSLEDVSIGVRRFLIGLAKKILVANTLAAAVDPIFAHSPGTISTPLAWVGIVGYALQIYFDFSGYSDMAIGLGRILGFRYLENFNFPYIASSIQEFWRRWHISLSSWFRDYLYIPLGGNRRGALRTYRNLFLVFFLCGLWHGASWTFVAWGVLHGVFIVLEKLGLARLLDRMWRPLRHAYALLVVLVAWVFFRSDTLAHAAQYLARMFGAGAGEILAFDVAYYLSPEVAIALLAGVVFSCPWQRVRDAWARPVPRLAAAAGQAVVVLIYLALLFGCVVLLAEEAYNPFIYFRF